MDSYNKGCYSHWSYNQGSYEKGFLQPWLVTRRGLLTKSSYNRGFTNEILTTRGLKTGGSYNKESYIRGFLQPDFLQSGVLHVQPGLDTSRSRTTRGS